MKIEKQSFFSRLFNKSKITPEQSQQGNSNSSNSSSFNVLNSAESNYGMATVNRSSLQDGSLTREQVEKILKGFLKNDEYKISMYSELFSNLDKLDYKNIHRHLQNIQTLFAMRVNFPGTIVKNGYFYSEDGAQAFDVLSAMLSSKSKSGYVSPLSIALGDYTPETVFVLKKRGLLSASEIENSKRLNKLAKLSDEDYLAFQKRVDESISKTGHSFEKLSISLKKELKPLLEPSSFETFEKKYLNRESVVAQKEILSILKKFPVKFEDYSLVELLADVNIDNVDAYKTIFPQLEKRKDISTANVPKILDLVNSKTVNIISNLLQDKEIPISKIIEYCDNDEFIEGSVSNDVILHRISNDSFLKSVQAIKSTPVNIVPQNIVPKNLNPLNIEPEALVLVHMTHYEPDNGLVLSTRDKLGGSRNSVHFSLNHPVTRHRCSWDDCACAVIMPYSSTVKLNGDDKFIEGMPNDLYTNGSVKIPEGSIIMKQNLELEAGTIDISEHPSIKGVKIIETSELPHDLVPFVIEKMGYTHLQADGPMGLFSQSANKGNEIDSAMDNFFSWKEFCETQGIKATRHTGSATDIAEKVIENVSMLCVKNSWIDSKYNQKDFRKKLFEYIDYAKSLQQKGYFISYDLELLRTILKESVTPKEAVSKIQEKLGFHPSVEYDCFFESSFEIPIELFSEWYSIEDSPRLVRKYILENEMDA